MKLNKNENRIVCDVDETLIFHDAYKYPTLSQVELNYYGHKKKFAIHEDHVKLLKAYKKRGFYIIVHSNNGYKWVEQVVNALGLFEFVDEGCTKAVKYVDDHKKASQVVGQHVYIPVEKKDVPE